MNLILLFDSDFISPTRVRLTGRRLTHIREILKAHKGQRLTVGKLNGPVGEGIIVENKPGCVELQVQCYQAAPQALSLELIMALPRPPMFKRMLFAASMLGIKKITVLHFNRVDKSFWNSSSLKPEAVKELLVLGLEQAKDTVMPDLIFKKRFKPFVEDELPLLVRGKLGLVAHPGESGDCFPPSPILTEAGVAAKPMVIMIGPEGGIVDYEIELLKAAGMKILDLGPRILRTEHVLPFIVGRFCR